MALYGRDRNRIEADQAQALEHSVRKRIVELHRRDPRQALEARVLAADLIRAFPDLKLSEARPAQVAYHVAVLRDAQLLPTT